VTVPPGRAEVETMTGEIVIAVYRAREGREAELEGLLARHLPTLRARGLVTERPGLLMRSRRDGTYLEVFEWKDGRAAHAAHGDPVVGPLWEAMGKVCDFLPLAELRESTQPFPHFEPFQA
jgi:hypothetical protein